MPGQMCDNVGLNGADPDRPIPPLGEGGGDGDGGVAAGDGGVAGGGSGDGGMSGGESGGGGSGGCVASGAQGGSPWTGLAMLFCVLVSAVRRRR